MKCYYEVLSVSRDADEGEIKNSYRKLALRYHPDKNLDNPQEAKEQFQLVQQAYEVLSDRQERAWYDNHREQILKGSNSEYQDNCLDVFQYFTTSCFKGYDDTDEGFYTVYRGVFEKLAHEEIEHLDSKSDFDDIPNFGRSTGDYENDVAPFYAYWMSFTTKKSYVWLDPYNIKETRERRILKLVEKENKKVRQKAKKERNEEIRNLVTFVRKRDKRVQAYAKQLEKRNLENRQKQEELRNLKRLERKKELEESLTEQVEWTKFDNLSSELKEIEKNLAAQFGEKIENSEDEENYEDNLYCVACNKIFKNAKAFANHELSRKHNDNLVRIKKEMEIEELQDSEENDDDDDDNEEEVIPSSDLDLNSVSEDIEEETATKQKKKNKRLKKVIRSVNHLSEDEEIVAKVVPEKVVPDVINNKDDVNGHEENDDDFGTNKKQQKKKKKNKPQQNKTTDEKNKNDPDDVDELEKPMLPRKSKRSVNKTNKNKYREEDEDDVDVEHYCLTCKCKFDSKNKLFEHLKKTGHGVALPQTVRPVTNNKKGRRNNV